MKAQHNVEVVRRKEFHPQDIVVRVPAIYCTAEGVVWVADGSDALSYLGCNAVEGMGGSGGLFRLQYPQTGPAPAGQPLPFRSSAPTDLLGTAAPRERRQGDGEPCKVRRPRPLTEQFRDRGLAKRRPAIRLGAVEGAAEVPSDGLGGVRARGCPSVGTRTFLVAVFAFHSDTTERAQQYHLAARLNVTEI